MNSFPRHKQELPDNWGYDLLRYGNEEIIRGSDTGTLVAFGAIAFQELKGEGLPHQHFGCGMLLFSVLLCAVVHFAVGGATIGRGQHIINGEQETRGNYYFRKTNQLIAWVAAALQFIMTVIGILLVLKSTPPPFLEKHLMSWF
ncbi:MAG: hypothetical protein P4L85_07570 [Paludisphaera borealis]|uniref:hypothetical protein n=1 Tax=Paludisphaera borealis TaxID=1387353 RepID=UPI00283DAB83|nr:hypothetical protein [Paludisphaera borealis]MDR3619193.1 hypothetical protein [Paludisphaera borealis]